MAKVLGYVRVSTEEQMKHGSGLEIQKEQITEYCRKNGLELIDIFSDEATSGSKENRTGLNKLLRYSRENKVSAVIIQKLDRLSRDTMYGLWVRKELTKVDVELISIKEEHVTGNDPVQNLMRTIIFAFAEFEKEQISGRLLSGRINKVENTKQKGSGNCPLGYVYKYTDNNNPIVVISEERALVIKEIYKLYMNGSSIQKIADILNDKGTLTERGGTFSKSSIHVILTNDFYTGIVRFDDLKVAGKHDPIISKIVFGKVKNKLKSNRKLNEGK